MPTRTATTLPFTEFPVGAGNFDSSRKPIDMIVLHSEAGYKAGTRAVFSQPPAARHAPLTNKASSAHYGVNLDGTLDHYLEEYLNAYHANNYDANLRSIGIENEDNANPNGVARTDAQYNTLIKLVADIAQFYAIPLDRDHVKKHNELSSTTCPGNLDIERVLAGARAILGQTVTPPSPSTGGIATVIVDVLFIRQTASPLSANLGRLVKRDEIKVTNSLVGDAVNGNNIWYKTTDNKFIWSGGVTVVSTPIPPTPAPTPPTVPQVGSDGEKADILRAGQVLADAIKRPEILASSGEKFGNAEGAAREMVGAWPSYINLIKDSKKSKNILETIAKLIGVS